MRLHELSAVLVKIADAGGPFGSEAEGALRAVALAFASQPDMLVSDLPKKLKPIRRTAQKAMPLQSKIPPQPVIELMEAFSALESHDRRIAFLAVMKKSKPYSAPVVKEAVARLLGSSKPFNTKPAAIEALRELIDRREHDGHVVSAIKLAAAS